MLNQLLLSSLLVGVSVSSPLPQERVPSLADYQAQLESQGRGLPQDVASLFYGVLEDNYGNLTSGNYTQPQTEDQSWWSSIPFIGEYQRYIPHSVKTFLKDTYVDGKEVLYDIYDDIQEEIMSKTDQHIDQFTMYSEEVIDKVVRIVEKNGENFMRDTPLSDEELTERALEVETTKERLRGLAEQVREEIRNEEEGEEGLAKAIQSFITSVRGMVANQVLSGNNWLWERMRHMEGTSYQALELVADSSEELKVLINDLFAKLAQIDLSKIGRPKDPAVLEPVVEVINGTEIETDGILVDDILVDVPRRGFNDY